MAGHSRRKDGVAFARLCPSHPRLYVATSRKTWMPGTSPGMTAYWAFRHCEEPTGRANARPMTGSATKQSSLALLPHGLLRFARNDEIERVGWVEPSETHRNVSAVTVGYGFA
jgi:hypothetical protein